MSIFRVKTTLDDRRECKRCHRLFRPRTEGQEYGSTCARKVAAGTPAVPDLGELVDTENELDRFGAD